MMCLPEPEGCNQRVRTEVLPTFFVMKELDNPIVQEEMVTIQKNGGLPFKDENALLTYYTTGLCQACQEKGGGND